jgi:hypothetical protein
VLFPFLSFCDTRTGISLLPVAMLIKVSFFSKISLRVLISLPIYCTYLGLFLNYVR